MKKMLCVLLAGIMLVGLAACGKSPAPTESLGTPDASKPTSVTTPTENETVGSEPSEAPTEETVESTAQPTTYTIYIPNDNANGFVTETVYTEDLSPEAVLAELKARNVLPEAVAINAFHIDNGLITIDFNQAFADVVCSMGTSGELMIVGSVVNTYLDAFQAESVYFTVDGQILESGHVIYDFALTFFEVVPEPES